MFLYLKVNKSQVPIEVTSEKLLRFDEEELRARNMMTRDYGHMNIWEAKTPFPRRGEAVAAKTLRQRLLELLNQSSSRDNSITSETDNMNIKNTGFIKKSKDLNMHEFHITRNNLSRPLEHEPGPSILNWRIVDTEPLNYDFTDDDNTSLQTFQSFDHAAQRIKPVEGFDKKLLNTSVLGHPTLLDTQSKQRNRKKASALVNKT